MDRGYDIEIQKTLDKIKEKTGVEVPRIIRVCNISHFDKKTIVNGIYFGKGCIVLNPRLFYEREMTDEEITKFLSDIGYKGITNEDIFRFRAVRTKTRIDDIHSVVAHER